MRARTLQIPNLELGALESGTGCPRRVLALHGWLDNAASFEPLSAWLENCHLVAIDLPGHGHSAHRPAGIHYHFVDFVPDVLAAADSLGWDRFTLLGHSLGAGIGCFVAAIAPERIERLALIEGIGPHSGMPDDEPDRLARASRQMRTGGGRPQAVYPDLAAAVAARLQAGGLSEDAATGLTTRAIRQDADGFRWRTDPRLRFSSPSYLSEPQVLAFLRRIACPTLLILGSEGSLVAREGVEARYGAIRDLDRVTLDGGHHLHLESPAAVAAALGPFLDGDI